MPAKRKTRSDRLREQFSAMYRSGKAVTGLRDPEIADSIGLSVTSLWSRRKDPSKLTLGEISKLSAVLRWSDEDVVKLINT